MAELQLVRINLRSGEETVLEITPVPNNFTTVTCFYSPGHIKELEEHYRRTGKPRKSKIDVLYVTRLQAERHR